MALLESEHSLIDVEMTGSEEPDQFQIPMLANEQGKTPYKQMHD